MTLRRKRKRFFYMKKHGDRPPDFLHPAYHRRGQHHRPYHRRLSGQSAAADRGAALSGSDRRGIAAAGSLCGRLYDSCLRGHDCDTRHPQYDSGWENSPDRRRHSFLHRSGHVFHGFQSADPLPGAGGNVKKLKQLTNVIECV